MNTVSINVKKFWQSSNFWATLALAIGGLFTGFNEELSNQFIAGIFTVLALGKQLHEFFKETGKFDKTKLWSSNFWAYLGVIISGIVTVSLPPELFESIRLVIKNAVEGNWQGILTALFTLGTILYNIFIKNKQRSSNVSIA